MDVVIFSFTVNGAGAAVALECAALRIVNLPKPDKNTGTGMLPLFVI